MEKIIVTEINSFIMSKKFNIWYMKFVNILIVLYPKESRLPWEYMFNAYISTFIPKSTLMKKNTK